MCNERIKTIYFTTLYSKNVHFHDSSKSANISQILLINLTLQLLGMNVLYTYVCQSVTVSSYVIPRASIMHIARSEIFINTFSKHYMFQEFCNTTYLRVTVL